VSFDAQFDFVAISIGSISIIPIFLRRYYANHPEVNFKPGPFYMPGLLGWACNVICIAWTCFVCVIFSFPNYRPVTPTNMNYASVITIGVVVLSGYVLSPSYSGHELTQG
jgi:hypothetical protein